MFKNNFLIAIRNLFKHKKYAFTNVFGLSIGLASFILIVIWVQDELSYDNFHKDADNIYAVFRQSNDKKFGATSKLLAPAIKDEIPEVIESTCLMPLPESFKTIFRYENQSFSQNITLADANFLKIFTFSLSEGDMNTAFQSPTSLVLTEGLKEKFFGEEEALGKTVSLNILGQTKLLKVTGVLNKIPHNSHIQPELIIPVDFMKTFGINWDKWNNQAPSTYIKVPENTSVADLEQKITTVKQSHFNEEEISYSVMPIRKIHLNASDVQFFYAKTGDIKYIYIFSAISIVIVLIASMNYVNLSNALALKRAKEIGVKKTLGGGKRQLILQYFTETFVVIFISLAIAVVVAILCLPFLDSITGKDMDISMLGYKFIGMVLAILLITTFVSGIYPAMYITAFNPLKIFKGSITSSASSLNIRKGLVVLQFMLSAIIIISTIIISRQLRFVQKRNLGYNHENLVCLSLNKDISPNYEAFKNELLASGFVSSVSRSSNMDISTMGKTNDVNWSGKQKKFSTWVFHVDDDFEKTYGIKMEQGKFFSGNSDQFKGFVINKKAAEEMGIENPLAQNIKMWGHEGPIIGITNDFNFSSLHNTVEPLIMMVPKPKEKGVHFTTLTLRLKADYLPESMDHIEKVWNEIYPNELFDFYFVDEKLEQSYFSEYRMGKIFRYFSMLTVFIACLGLYGLVAFVMEQKNKEIGVYKVFGSSVSNLVYKYSKSYIFWIVLANMIATPIAWYAMHKWLENFAYKTTLSWWIFALAGVIALGIALLTVSWQSWRAATRNPVEALRYE